MFEQGKKKGNQASSRAQDIRKAFASVFSLNIGVIVCVLVFLSWFVPEDQPLPDAELQRIAAKIENLESSDRQRDIHELLESEEMLRSNIILVFNNGAKLMIVVAALNAFLGGAWWFIVSKWSKS